MRANGMRTVLAVAASLIVLAGCGSSSTESSAPADTEQPASSASSPAVAADEAEEVAGAEHTEEAAGAEHTEEAAGAELTDEAAHTDEHDHDADAHAGEGFAFGEPADPADADRTVQIVASDEMAFDPSTVEVHAGEVVTFEVENVGQLPHDFTLGDEAAQQAHAREMEEMGAEMAHDDPNAMTVAPGETNAITWRFTDAGEVLYGCHQPGHYDAGMVGTIDVTS